MQLKYQILANH